MYTIFIEYRVFSHAVSDFLKAHYSSVQKQASSLGKSYRFLKGTDQQDIFVEMLQLESLQSYELWKKQLQEEDSALPWHPILPYIIGGSAKFNMWAFKEPALSEYI